MSILPTKRYKYLSKNATLFHQHLWWHFKGLFWTLQMDNGRTKCGRSRRFTMALDGLYRILVEVAGWSQHLESPGLSLIICSKKIDRFIQVEIVLWNCKAVQLYWFKSNGIISAEDLSSHTSMSSQRHTALWNWTLGPYLFQLKIFRIFIFLYLLLQKIFFYIWKLYYFWQWQLLGVSLKIKTNWTWNTAISITNIKSRHRRKTICGFKRMT